MAESVVPLLDHLMEVGRVGEWAQAAGDVRRAPGVAGKVDVQGRAQLHASDLDARGLQPRPAPPPGPRYSTAKWQQSKQSRT